MHLNKRSWVIVAASAVVLTIGLWVGIPWVQDYFYERSIQQGSVNTFVAPGGTNTIHFVTKTADGSSIIPDAYFSIAWRDPAGKSVGEKYMRSNQQGQATAVLPAGSVDAGWSPASNDFYLPSSFCLSETSEPISCPIVDGATIEVTEGVLIGD